MPASAFRFPSARFAWSPLPELANEGPVVSHSPRRHSTLRIVDHQKEDDSATNMLAELSDDSKMAGKDLAYFDKLIALYRGAQVSLANPVYDEMIIDLEQDIAALEASQP